MTDNNHPITPPPELVRDWAQRAQLLSGDDPVSFAELLCNKAARWGADQELEACCEWLKGTAHVGIDFELINARRPKPPSLKEQALEVLNAWCEERNGPGESILCDGLHVHTIRQALELLND